MLRPVPGLGDYALLFGGMGIGAGIALGILTAAVCYAIYRGRRPGRWYARRALVAAGLPVAFAALVVGAIALSRIIF